MKQSWLRGGFAVLMLLLVLAIQPGWAQEATGAISGSVKDPSGAVIANAKVTLTDTDKNIVVRTFTTGNSGGWYPRRSPSINCLFS